MSALRAKADAACSRCKWLLLTPTGSQAHLRARSGLARAHDDYRLKPLPDRPLTPVNRSDATGTRCRTTASQAAASIRTR